MKRIYVLIIIVALFGLLSLSIWHSDTLPRENLYAKSARVIDVDYENDLVSIEDPNGFCWGFEGCEDWMVGDYCACVMNKKGTNTIFDDEIVSVIYQGFEKTF